MMTMFLIIVGQTVAAPQSASPKPTKKPPSIYALVFVARRPAWEVRNRRKEQMVVEAAWARYHHEVNAVVLRADAVSRLKIVEKLKELPPTEPREWLRENLRVESLEDTGVLRISLEAGSPTEQVVIVNAAAKAYIRVASENRRERYEYCIARDSKHCAHARMAILNAEWGILKLCWKVAMNQTEAERLARRRNGLTRSIAFLKERIEKTEAQILKMQEALRNRHYILLELAELPSESK